MSKIPATAKLAYAGPIFKVFTWPQKLYDGSEVMFEAVTRADSVEVIPTDGETIYYSRQQQPDRGEFLAFFGGRLEEGEDPLTAGKRELLEEAGLESDDWQLLFTRTSEGKVHNTRHYYLARNCRRVASPKPDAGERIEVLAATPRQFFAEVLTSPHLRSQEVKSYFYSAFDAERAATFTAQLKA